MVAPSDQPTPIAPCRSSDCGKLGDVGRHPLDGRAGAVARGRGAMAAQIDGDHAMVPRQLVLRAEEAAMRHQPVQQHDRRAVAGIAIGDRRPVRSGKRVQSPSQRKPLFAGFCPNGTKLN